MNGEVKFSSHCTGLLYKKKYNSKTYVLVFMYRMNDNQCQLEAIFCCFTNPDYLLVYFRVVLTCFYLLKKVLLRLIGLGNAQTLDKSQL